MTDLSMFNYLTRDVPKSVVDLDLIHEYAKTAANSFLGPSNIPLNDSIEKIAHSSSLSPDHVNLVCQEANKEVHAALFDRSENKYTVFDLANSAQILDDMGGGQVKTASSDIFTNDYGMSPSEQNGNADFQVFGTSGHSGLNDSIQMVKRATVEKIAVELDRALKDRVLLEDQMHYLDKTFIKEARNHLTQVPLDCRRDLYPELYHFNKMAGLGTYDNKRLMTMLDYVMVNQGLMEKSAGSEVADEYIDYDMDARIINGNHPMEAVIKTIVDNRDKQNVLTDRVNLIQDTVAPDTFDGRNGGAVLGYKRVRNL